MLYFVIPLFFGFTSSAPADSCDDQFGCLHTDITEVDDGQYEICLYWDSSLSSCDKSGTMSHACPSGDEADKIEGFAEGRSNAMCNTVDCDGYAVFGIKDGRGCGGSSGVYGFDGVTGIYCGAETDGGFCGGGNQKDCMWVIPAPECEDDTTTTTTSSPSTTATTRDDDDETTTTGSTTEAETTQTVNCFVEDSGCAEFSSRDGCENGPIAGCVWTETEPEIGHCEVDPCGLPEPLCVAQCGCHYVASVGCIGLPTELAANAVLREDAYDDQQLSGNEDINSAMRYGASIWLVFMSTSALFVFTQ